MANEYVTPEVSIDDGPDSFISFVLGPVFFVAAAVVWIAGFAVDYAGVVNVAVGANAVATVLGVYTVVDDNSGQ